MSPSLSDLQDHHLPVPPPRRILITQSFPAHKSSRYEQLAKHHHLHIDFQSFLRIEPIPVTSFRIFKPRLIVATAFIFTNKIAIDSFFTLAKACSIKLSPEVKFFCTTELVANYLQRYMILRKRKVFFSTGDMEDFFKLLKKHRREKFCFPCSDNKRPDITNFFKTSTSTCREMVIYHTKFENPGDLDYTHYELVTFFSPLEVKAFASSFPKFKKAAIQVALFGANTLKAVKALGWKVAVKAPSDQHTSLVDALDDYFSKEA